MVVSYPSGADPPQRGLPPRLNCNRQPTDAQSRECFYEAYLQFEYVAIVQADAFVRKSLTSIADFDLDYLGAPWKEGVHYRSVNGRLFVDQPAGTGRRKIRRRLRKFRYGIRIAGSALAGAVFQEQLTRGQAVAADLWGVHAPSPE